ncbi:unnamed protein product [Angiostrongylus costaricensis]|uniref:Membrane transporter n=1 Tax=Angiostrongylus costaricensis TaxID=334426 RepID=A0A158PGE7_ANGCS|nr:unnamed protein product [Angiostrongylus costaricensis]
MEKKTDWKAVTMAGIVTFLSAVENTVVTMSEWPYMHTIDREATSQFFGFVSSVSKFGHAMFAVVFAFWTYKIRSTKMPLIVGRVTAFVACCLYLSVELLPEGRRYLMLLCYFLFGIASSSSAVLRAYLAAVSTTQDRAKAYSAFVVATMLSIVIGPVCQLIFASIRYPGFVLIEGFLMFHIYSAPIWIATFTNFISVAIIHYFLIPRLPTTWKFDLMNIQMGYSFNLENTKAWIRRLHSMDLNWPLIIVFWSRLFLASYMNHIQYSVVSPFVMISYGWDGQKTVNVLSLCMGVVGVLAIIIAVAFIFLRFGNIISPRCSFLLAASVTAAMYVLSYPYEMTSHKMLPYNETLGTGCDTRQYTWCDTAYGTSPIVFLSVTCVVMGIGVPMSAISLDTIYSKVLGNIDQVISSDDIVSTEPSLFKVRPIISCADGPTLLKYIPAHLTYTQMFLDRLRNARPNKAYVVKSFDVTALYTNGRMTPLCKP